MGNVRDVGFTVGYTLPTDVPITVEGGLFNGSGLTNQKEWQGSELLRQSPVLFTKGLNLTLSVQASNRKKYVCNPMTSVRLL